MNVRSRQWAGSGVLVEEFSVDPLAFDFHKLLGSLDCHSWWNLQSQRGVAFYDYFDSLAAARKGDAQHQITHDQR